MKIYDLTENKSKSVSRHITKTHFTSIVKQINFIFKEIIMSSDSDFDDLAVAIKGVDSNQDARDVSDTERESEGDDENSSDENEETRANRKRRRISSEDEDDDDYELNKFLFGDKEEFVRKLKGEKLIFADVTGTNDSVDPQLQKPSVWQDSDDEDFKKSVVDGDQLKKKFERITGSTPAWAKIGRKTNEEDSDDDEVTKTVGHLGKSTSKDLPKGELNFKRLANINKATMKEGRISSIIFHPNSTVGIVAGLKGIVSMFAIDGRENKKYELRIKA